jgi:hypothetical protein
MARPGLEPGTHDLQAVVNFSRTAQGAGRAEPIQRGRETTAVEIRRRDKLGGLLHEYYRAAS